jgi:hypothetical protein
MKIRVHQTFGRRLHRPHRSLRRLTGAITALLACTAIGAAAASADADLPKSFATQIHPLLVKTCGKCHGETPKDNDLNITGIATAEAFFAKPAVLADIAARLVDGDMPPRKAPQPSVAEREQLLQWVQTALDFTASAKAGDPGPVTLRRLTNNAYDNAIRDLTGVDMRPTRAGEFPPDSVGGEGFANVGDAMPMNPGLVERYHDAARYVAARAVLLPSGLRFSPSADRPDWTAQAEKALRSFHALHAGPRGEAPLEKHLAATLKHRSRLLGGGPGEIAAVATEENLNPTYLAALWNGLGAPLAKLPPAEVEALNREWHERAIKGATEKQRRQTLFDSAKTRIDSRWKASKHVVAQSKVPEGGSVPFEQKVVVQPGELLLLTVHPNENYGADSTLLEWSIRETGGQQRSWSLSDLLPNLLNSNPLPGKHNASWSFLETTTSPAFLTDRRDGISGKSELKSWSLGSEPSVFVNSAAEDARVWTQLRARSVFVHPGPKRPVSIAWTSPVAGELALNGLVADAHPGAGDGVSFELSHLAAAELGKALTDLSPKPDGVPSSSLPPDALAHVREVWRNATDPAPVLAAIKLLQERLFRDNYRKHSVLAVGNGFPAWEETLRIVAGERAESAAREPVFRLVARQVAPALAGTFVIWDRLRLEDGRTPDLLLAEHPELRAAIETASGLKFGTHPQGRTVPPTALVTEAGTEVRIDLKSLPKPLLDTLGLPRFLRADVRLDDASPEAATVQALLLAEPDSKDPKDPTKPNPRRAIPTAWRSGDPLITEEPEPRVAQIAHPRAASERARPANEFRALFPPALLFADVIPRDAQGSLFMFHREDEPLRRLMLDADSRRELERLWNELHFLREDATAHALMHAELLKFYENPNGAPRMDFYFKAAGERVSRELAELAAAQTASEPTHLDALLAFAERAWRRPLVTGERDAILAAYRSDRADGTKHDPALRAALARVLSSPWFLYRVEQPATGPHWQPVSGDELASRLSFLLWDSIPDQTLRAAAPKLREPAVLEAQLQRMLRDERVRGMAEEFGARWLGVRDFVANHGRSLKDFPKFTPAVRDLLAEEPVRFFADSLRNDRPVEQLLTADATVLNDALASFYGIPDVKGNEWRLVEKVSQHGRGGVLGLGAVLAKQSAAARTSPIKRGAWLAHLLGDRLPKPPATVPPLPETPPEGLTVRELTARHREDPSCSGCHDRIDPYGLAFETFDAIGRLRPANQLKPGESRSTLRDGTEVDGFAGIRNYVVGTRRSDLLKTLARKLTGYALSRAVLPSDRALVDAVGKTLIDGGRWSDALLVLARSEQFQSIRPATATASTTP